MIEPGTEYAKVYSPTHTSMRFAIGRMWPEAKDFHFECVPPDVRPLVRFFQ